jgi:hypothetical protein
MSHLNRRQKRTFAVNYLCITICIAATAFEQGSMAAAASRAHSVPGSVSRSQAVGATRREVLCVR